MLAGIRRGCQPSHRQRRRDAAARVLRLRQELEKLAGRVAVAGDEQAAAPAQARAPKHHPPSPAPDGQGGEHRAPDARHADERLVAALARPGETPREQVVGRFERGAVALELRRLAGPRRRQPADAVPLEHADGPLELLPVRRRRQPRSEAG